MNNMCRVTTYDFKSITEFLDYLDQNEVKDNFKGKQKSKVKGGLATNFTGTKDYEEANSLLVNGWEDKAEELEAEIRVISNGVGNGIGSKRTRVNDIAGYIANVPRYLRGIPDNMVRTDIVKSNKGIVKLVKDIGYSSAITAGEILRESAKALSIVKRLETIGHSVELSIMVCTHMEKKADSNIIVCRVRIKSASERLNTLKLAYPMCHPSMSRRHMFAFMERQTVPKEVVNSYGYIVSNKLISRIVTDAYILPRKITADINSIKSIKDIT